MNAIALKKIDKVLSKYSIVDFSEEHVNAACDLNADANKIPMNHSSSDIEDRKSEYGNNFNNEINDVKMNKVVKDEETDEIIDDDNLQFRNQHRNNERDNLLENATSKFKESDESEDKNEYLNFEEIAEIAEVLHDQKE